MKQRSVQGGQSRQCGFTLLEVLVALTIIVVALGAALSVAGENMQNTGYLKKKTVAHWVAINKAVQWRIERKWPKVGRQSGSEIMANQEWRWEILTNETPDKDVKRLEVLIFEEGADSKTPLIRHTAFLGRPL